MRSCDGDTKDRTYRDAVDLGIRRAVGQRVAVSVGAKGKLSPPTCATGLDLHDDGVHWDGVLSVILVDRLIDLTPDLPVYNALATYNASIRVRA